MSRTVTVVTTVARDVEAMSVGLTSMLWIVRRPALWGEALRAAWAHRRRAWWRRFPFLPSPGGDYLAWRLSTVYGDDRRLDPDDLVVYLAWRRHLREVMG